MSTIHRSSWHGTVHSLRGVRREFGQRCVSTFDYVHAIGVSTRFSRGEYGERKVLNCLMNDLHQNWTFGVRSEKPCRFGCPTWKLPSNLWNSSHHLSSGRLVSHRYLVQDLRHLRVGYPWACGVSKTVPVFLGLIRLIPLLAGHAFLSHPPFFWCLVTRSSRAQEIKTCQALPRLSRTSHCRPAVSAVAPCLGGPIGCESPQLPFDFLPEVPAQLPAGEVDWNGAVQSHCFLH